MTWIATQNHITAFQHDIQLQYRHSNCESYPEDYYQMMKGMLKTFLDTSENFVVMLACSKMDQDLGVVQPVAHSIWRTVNVHGPSSTSKYLKNRIDNGHG